MNAHMNVLINIGVKDTQRDAYPVQIQHEGKPLADDWIHINREALLENEHKFSAHDYGIELCSTLLTKKLDRIYQRLIGQATAETAIRVQLVIHPDAPELHVLPWERLFHVFSNTETPISTDARTPFSRFLVSGAGDQPTVLERPLRMLVAVANPSNLPDGCSPLDVEGEVTGLVDLLANSTERVQGTLLADRSQLSTALQARLAQQGWSLAKDNEITSWQTIQRHLLPGQHILHVLAHGQFSEGTAYLLLEDEGSDKVARGSMERVADNVIIPGLAGVHPLPHLIFLAACDSAKRPEASTATTGANPFVGLAPKLVEAGVPAVVAMQDEVPMDLAHTLAADFYRRLFEHGQVDLALNEARNLVYKNNQFEWAIPVLFLSLQDGRLFSTTPIVQRKSFEPETVPIPKGKFLMGSQPGEEVPTYKARQDLIHLEHYRIGQFPVTNREYAEFIRHNKTQKVPTHDWIQRKPPANTLDYPVVAVSWHDAVAYCQWLSNQTKRSYRLPTEAEWEKAARGNEGWLYPWGNEWEVGYSPEMHTKITPACITNANETKPYYPKGRSPYGCYDMIGNVQEWTSTLWGDNFTKSDYPYPYKANDGREDPDGGITVYRICRGGLVCGETRLQCASRSRMRSDATTMQLGFRVVLEV